MVRSDDRSVGDGRKPYSDEGGPEAHHAKTHDVAREAATNTPPQDEKPDEFADDLANDNRSR